MTGGVERRNEVFTGLAISGGLRRAEERGIGVGLII
jgi:hypothetical protein